MHDQDRRAEHLAWIETALRAAYPDLTRLRILAQSHFGPADRIASIDIYGLEHDRDQRRTLRAEAEGLLRRLGYQVDLEPGRDVYNIVPARPYTAHDRLLMLKRLQTAIRPK